MAETIAEVYRAFRSAGVPEEQAEEAAAALTHLRDEQWKRTMEVRLERIDGTLRLHAWRLGTAIAMLTVVLFRVFTL